MLGYLVHQVFVEAKRQGHFVRRDWTHVALVVDIDLDAEGTHKDVRVWR